MQATVWIPAKNINKIVKPASVKGIFYVLEMTDNLPEPVIINFRKKLLIKDYNLHF